MQRRNFLITIAGAAGALLLGGCDRRRAGESAVAVAATGAATGRWDLSPAQWRQRLTPAQFRILREDGTEPPFSSPLDHETRSGIYHCAGCALPLYSSATQYDSGTGWPSFWKPLPHAIATRSDDSLWMTRTEVHCRRCKGHLGHVFKDGPPPTGLRYCMNGLALAFHPGEHA
ncbi:peptide-methionine (R)-S-oxide reductase MsrB [Oleiagrimonas sp.]|jgi:peptide-methionine (R)-S-oxide reductase|uniref:peptide-methionine (R)-S-oxide reductase MsrB n=1 Tax=Oleiagrimonas sp. TaxID=2010330 RepID=UPI00260FF05C|nr:peptide-methionine (R)-S-oxide reductase MsrB [Oleiagrimonas sp.]MDA3913491.1 peptide-methionine (R)-S-oxide reductase MsrB [Oleiagrimonas sp.]